MFFQLKASVHFSFERYSPFYYLNFLLYNSNKQFFLAAPWPEVKYLCWYISTHSRDQPTKCCIIHTFFEDCVSKYGPLLLVSLSVATFLLADELLGLFKLLPFASMDKSLFCLVESRCDPCTVEKYFRYVKIIVIFVILLALKIVFNCTIQVPLYAFQHSTSCGPSMEYAIVYNLGSRTTKIALVENWICIQYTQFIIN